MIDYSEEEILGYVVHFMLVGCNYAWLVKMNGKEYGNYTTMDSDTLYEDYKKVLMINAEETIAELLK